MNNFLQKHPHRRFNPLTGEWLLVSPHRVRRPWQGKQEEPSEEIRPVYDPDCYLCPGNLRANGERNPPYQGVFVFTNDFAALKPDSPLWKSEEEPFLRSEGVRGTCRVICFSPRHDLTIPLMSTGEIRLVIDVWAEQILELGQKYTWVQIFENKGEIMGCSNPHPHGQIWASNFIPDEVKKEDIHQQCYYQENQSVLLLDYLHCEEEKRKRIILENEHWSWLMPFWAVWPFETILIPRQQILRLSDLSDKQRNSLADILKRLLTRYDNLFHISFPYTMGWHGAPTAGGNYAHWQLHAHFYPPLLRSSTVKKFMVGYEMLAEAQRDITPETAAMRLKKLKDIHYKISTEISRK